MLTNLWCSFWAKLQDIAFWLDDNMWTVGAGSLVERLAVKLTPNNW